MKKVYHQRGMSLKERNLAERALAGDAFARDQMLAAMEPFILSKAKWVNVRNPAHSIDDLVNAAWLRMLEHFGQFDPARNFLPLTYFGKVAFRAMIDLVKRDRIIPMPNDAKTESTKRQVEKTRRVGSLDAYLTEEHNSIGPDLFLASREREPGDLAAENEIVDRIHRCIARLPETRRRILLMRMDGMTLLEVGRVIGRTRERVRQIETQARELLAVALWREEHRR